MLTQKQKDQLEKLRVECKIPSLKRVLNKAIPRWISGEIEPKQYQFGVSYLNSSFIPWKEKRCCLLGTAIIDKKCSNNKSWSFLLGISDIDFCSCHRAFDNLQFIGDLENKEIHDYVSKIRKVIFKE